MATDFPEDTAASVLKDRVLGDSQEIRLFISILLYSFAFSLQPFFAYYLFHSSFSLILFLFYYGWHISFCYIYTFYCKSAPFPHVASSRHFTPSRIHIGYQYTYFVLVVQLLYFAHILVLLFRATIFDNIPSLLR